MRSLYDFIIKPLDKRYNNEKKVDDKTLITNTRIEDYKSVSKIGVVISVPWAFSGDIERGDHIVVHHNVFRRFYDIRGVEKNSRSYFKNDMYFCSPDQVYLYKKNNQWKSFLDRCFVKPIKNRQPFTFKTTEPLIGIVKYDNTVLNDLGIANGMLVGFKPDSEFEFIIDGELLYCMKSNDIVIKYEYQGDEEEYNPSWAKSS
tara:strand:+ start:125 stop:730 length:606 start_codon:yes stop_codon:yes gene_type:complete